MKGAAFLLFFFVAHASAGVSFDVASIKVSTAAGEVNNRPADEKVRIGPGGISMTNVTLVTCLMNAYGIGRFQVSVPAWMNSARYDITAKAAGPAPQDQLRLMLRTLLTDRFHLTFHQDRKDVKVYALTQDKRGSKLRETAQSGDKFMAMEGGAIVFRNYTVADLIDTLSNAPFRIDRPVIDTTGLTRTYDFEIKIAADELAMKHAFEGMMKADGDGPSLIDLVQDQLGLRFTPTQHSLEVMTVDGADKTPAGN